MSNRVEDGSARERRIAREIEANAQRLLQCVRAELGGRLRTRVDSADIVQQTMVDALRDIDRFEERSPEGLFAWLRTIARNRIRDVDRQGFRTIKRGGEVRVADIDLSDVSRLLEVAASRSGPTAGARRNEEVTRLAWALRQLPESQREAIQLRYFEQLDVPAAAARMERSERAIRALCVRGLVCLRQLLGHGA